MEALHSAIALAEAVNVDSDTSRIVGSFTDRTSQRRGRKQSNPLRSAFSSDTPSDTHTSTAPRQQPTIAVFDDNRVESSAVHPYTSTGTEVYNRVEYSASTSTGSKNPLAQRQGPCGHCKAPDSPQWRKGPRNKPVLCNACGIRYLRNRHLGRSVPQKKRAATPNLKGRAHTDCAAETSTDTTTDTTDMRAGYKKRRTKKMDVDDEDVSTYSYDGSVQGTLDSYDSFSSMHSLAHTTQQQQTAYSDAEPAFAGTSFAGGPAAASSGDASLAVASGDVAGADVSLLRGLTGAAPGSAEPAAVMLGTSMTLPGNMAPVLLMADTIHNTSNRIDSSQTAQGAYGIALALQWYQQQQLLYNQQRLLLSTAASSESQAAADRLASHSAALLTSISSQEPLAPTPSAQTPLAAPVSASASLRYSEAFMQPQSSAADVSAGLNFPRQQAHTHAHASALQTMSSMLHGPSPLSLMTSANLPHQHSSLALRPGGSLGLQVPSASAVPNAHTSLEIAPLAAQGSKVENPMLQLASLALAAQAAAAAAVAEQPAGTAAGHGA